MKIFGNLKNLFSRSSNAGTTRVDAEPPIGWRYGYDLTAPVSTPLKIATVYSCVNILADAVANLPIQYMRQKDGIFVTDVNSRLHYLLTVQPCDYMSAFDFWHLAMQHILLKGNAYIVPEYDLTRMDYGRLVLVNPDTVSHDTINDTYDIADVHAGISGRFYEDEVIHLINFSLDGKDGKSTLYHAKMSTDIASSGDAETLNRFKNGGNVRGIVSNDTSVRGFGEYQEKQLKQAATDLDERFRAGERIVSIPGQTQFSQVSLSSTDMQFLETRKFSVRDICRFFRVHPSFVFDDTSNNYKSAEMANVAFLNQTLNPWLRKIENELTRKLISESLINKRRIQFDRQSINACDLDSRIKYQAATIAAGLYTVNEWRQKENKPAVEGGDKVLVSANLKGINDDSIVAPIDNNQNKNNDGEE